MDGRRFINAMFTSDKAESITQVVMNLPNDAAEFLGGLLLSGTTCSSLLFEIESAELPRFHSILSELLQSSKFWLSYHLPDAFRGIFRKKSRDKQLKLPMIHVYGFSKAQDPEFDFHQVWFWEVSQKMKTLWHTVVN